MTFNINSINIDAWSSKENGNDCWWNIAKNQAGEGASNAEIRQIMNRIFEYNNEKNGTQCTLDDVIYEGQQVLIPIEYAIDDIEANITALTNDHNTYLGNYKNSCAALEQANSNVSVACNKLSAAQVQINNFADKDSLQMNLFKSQLSAAQSEYTAALEEQKNNKKLWIKTKLI